MERKRFHRSIIFLLLLTPFFVCGKPVHYSFISKWEVRAPLEKVWELIDKGEDWHLWWKSVVGTEVLNESTVGDTGQLIHYTWRALLPFTLSINFRITRKEMYKCIEGVSTGDLVGTGVWTFEEHNGITFIQYQWEVESTKKLINLISPLFKGFFTYNHNLIMHRGAKGLAKRLGAKLVAG